MAAPDTDQVEPKTPDHAEEKATAAEEPESARELLEAREEAEQEKIAQPGRHSDE